MGMPFEPPSVRLDRLVEAVTLIKRLFQEDSVTYDGRHYRVRQLDLQPKPIQRPYPPLFIGGGGKRILKFAAQEATIVGLAIKTTAAGLLDSASTTAEAVAEKVRWVSDAAGVRFSDLELHILTTNVIITDDRQRGAETVAERLSELSWIAINTGLSTAQILESPYVLIGTVDQIVETLKERRERYGISYITIVGDIEAFGPIVTRLADQ
jgi:probable F420-dependent oxidoreductase